jgi:hypothetical protein
MASARDFHGRYDGHAPTVTLIHDAAGNIFGGFTPMAWESRTGNWSECSKADSSMKSVVFALKNPHNFPTRTFVLKAAKNGGAILDDSSLGSCFCDIRVSDNCNADARSGSYVGWSYANDTDLDGQTGLTDSE